MLRSSRNRLDMAIVLAVAFLTNFAYLIFSSGDFYYPDSFTYLAPARSLLRGAGLLNASNLVDSLRTPGYPLLLALFGARTLPVIILQHLLNVGLAIAIYVFTAARIDRWTALVASLLFAIDVPTIHYANKLLTETVFTALLYVIFVLTAAYVGPPPSAAGRRGRRPYNAIAFLTGVLVLVRPIALFFFAAIAVVLAIWRVSARQMASYVILALLLPIGWAARNKVQTGVFTVSAIGGINLLTHRAAGALAIDDAGDNFKKDLADEQSGLSEDADDELQTKLEVADAQELPESVRAAYYEKVAWRVIRQHPVALLQLTIRGVLVNLFDSDWDAVAEISTISPEILRVTLGVIPIIVFVFATIGIIDLWRHDRALALLIVITVAYFIGISAGSEAESRFRVPVAPQLAIAAAAGVAAVRRGLAV